jgi:hypothetical protein
VHTNSDTLAPIAAARDPGLDERRSSYIIASDGFTSTASDVDHFLKNFESSNERWHWFCGRCGPHIAYTAEMPETSPDKLEITMGSNDRGALEREVLVPERHL